jgi:iodotyrosine deiodinase
MDLFSAKSGFVSGLGFQRCESVVAKFLIVPSMTKTPRFTPAPKIECRSDEELIQRAWEFFQMLRRRRTIRDFSDRPVPREVIEHCIRAQGTAPSGANLQPWHFVAVNDAKVKHQIRIAAEAEEKEFYEHRAPKAWLDALAVLGTDWQKPFLEIASWLIAVFAQPFRILRDGMRSPTYYALDSVGIATGLLVTALHSCGLAALTHTPSPMGFLNRILGRPSHEKAFVLLVVGHPVENARVPDISRKSLQEISSFVSVI